MHAERAEKSSMNLQIPHNVITSLGIDSYQVLAHKNIKGKGGEFDLRC